MTTKIADALDGYFPNAHRQQNLCLDELLLANYKKYLVQMNKIITGQKVEYFITVKFNK